MTDLKFDLRDTGETYFQDWVIVESPFAGDTEANLKYARRACRDCLMRGELPFASHLFFPQFLDDTNPAERKIGIDGGYEMWEAFVHPSIVFYLDRGWSPGMLKALDRAKAMGLTHEIRYLDA